MSGGGGVQSIGTGLHLVTSKLAFRRRVLFGILAICMQMTTVIWAADENHEPEKSKFKKGFFSHTGGLKCKHSLTELNLLNKESLY